MSSLALCLWFDGQAVEAARRYTELIPNSQMTTVVPHAEGLPQPAGSPMLVEFTVAGTRLQGLNGGPVFRPNPSISLFVYVPSAEEATRMYHGLADGGSDLMPLGAYPWSPCYAWVQDRYGVSWQVMTAPVESVKVAPCLMFCGAQQGRAEAAMGQYAGLFGGRIDAIERYATDEALPGGVKHGRFTLAGQTFVAMDSHLDHGFGFTEGVSISVLCADQAEVDRVWAGLCDGGEPSRCGWCKDRFGVSWQVVPAGMVALQKRGDQTANTRMFAAMMGMAKLDMAALERAWFAAAP